MNKNTNRIDAIDLSEGQDFIFNAAGGNTTVYRATRVRSGGGLTLIHYTIPASLMRTESTLSCASLSSLVLV